MINFGMASCLITFNRKFYEYQGKGDQNDKGLAIGGYESAFLADLVASYLLEMTKHHFTNTRYHGIYQDDDMILFQGTRKITELKLWLKRFQNSINQITNGTFLQFTMEIWDETRENHKEIMEDNDDNKNTLELSTHNTIYLTLTIYNLQCYNV